MFVGLKKKAGVDEVKAAMREFGEEFVALELPSAPQHLITVSDDPFGRSRGSIATPKTG